MDDTSEEEDDDKKKLVDMDEAEEKRRERALRAKAKRAARRAACPVTARKFEVINEVEYEHGTVSLYEYEHIECNGAVVLEGVPSEGLPASIAAQYLVDELGLPLIGEIRGYAEDPVCVVRWSQPSHGLQIYGNQSIVVFTALTAPPPSVALALAPAIFDFARRHQCPHVVTFEGIQEQLSIEVDDPSDEVAIMNLIEKSAMAPKARTLRFMTNDTDTSDRLMALACKPLRGAIISGVTGGILARASTSRSVKVTGLLSPFSSFGGHARGALGLVKCLVALFDIQGLDLSTLEEDAEDVEDEIRKVFDAQKAKATSMQRNSSMYI